MLNSTIKFYAIIPFLLALCFTLSCGKKTELAGQGDQPKATPVPNPLAIGQIKEQKFTSAGKVSWVVPKNVYRIHVMGCSGGDGGTGGQAGQGGTSTGYWNDGNGYIHHFFGDNAFKIQEPVTYAPGVLIPAHYIAYMFGDAGGFGESGEKGEITSFSHQMIRSGNTLENEFVTPQNSTDRFQDIEGFCKDGNGGAGGAGGETSRGDWADNSNGKRTPPIPHAATGTVGSFAKNKRLLEKDIAVNPGDILNITLGKGGKGGIGGKPSDALCPGCGHREPGKREGWNGYEMEYAGPGAAGETGSDGASGYLSLSYTDM